MPRISKNIERTTLTLDRDILAELEQYLLDNTRVPPRPQYGAMSKVVNGLLELLLAELRKPDVDPIVVFRRFNIELVKTSAPTAEQET